MLKCTQENIMSAIKAGRLWMIPCTHVTTIYSDAMVLSTLRVLFLFAVSWYEKHAPPRGKLSVQPSLVQERCLAFDTTQH